jgi:hypothetical protein
MKIRITTQILSGNLGDGCSDQDAAADALAAFTERTWMDDLSWIVAEGHELEINIDVQHNTSGAAYDMEVFVGQDSDSDDDLFRRVESALTDEQVIWDRFVKSEAV